MCWVVGLVVGGTSWYCEGTLPCRLEVVVLLVGLGWEGDVACGVVVVDGVGAFEVVGRTIVQEGTFRIGQGTAKRNELLLR